MNQAELRRRAGVEVTDLGTAITHCEQTADYADTVHSALSGISDKLKAAERGLTAEASIYEHGLANVADEGFTGKVTGHFSSAAAALSTAAAALRDTHAKVQAAGEQVGVAGDQMRDVRETLSGQLAISDAVGAAAQDGGVATRTSFYLADGGSAGTTSPPPAAAPLADAEASVAAPVRAARELAAAYQQGYTVEASLPSGRHAVSVQLVRLANGSLAVRKEVDRSENPDEVLDAYLAGLVAEALEIPHTTTAMLNDTTVLSRFVPGVSGADRRREAGEIDGAGARLSTFELEYLTNLEGGREIGLLDFLTGNLDRNDGNFHIAEVTDPGRVAGRAAVYPLDHAFAIFGSLGPDEDEVLLYSPFSQAHLHRSQRVRDNNDPPLPVAPGELVSPYYGTELAPIRERLQELAPEFTAQGAAAKHEFLMGRLAMLTALTYTKPSSTSVGAASVQELDGFTAVEDVFEAGYCHALALAVHERTGWPVVGLGERSFSDSSHYLVRRPDGMLVDVRGVRAEADVLQQWDGGDGYYTVHEGDADFLWREVERGDMEDPADVWQLAHHVAQAVTEQSGSV